MSTHMRRRLLLGLAASLSTGWSQAGPLLDRLRERREGTGTGSPAGKTTGQPQAADLAYGTEVEQTLDVYRPQNPLAGTLAPIILMVHGGGWKHGDKTMGRVVDAKVERWVKRGFVFVSINYRMLPEAGPDVQLQDVARALAFVQDQAASWGGDPARVILMGHSAGAHLVSLLTVSPFDSFSPRPRPVLGTVSLDSAAMDVEQVMNHKHYRLYDEPFGTDPAYWRRMSPAHVLAPGSAPILAVYSTRREDSVQQTRQFAAKAQAQGLRVATLGQDLSHGEINSQLGLDSDYTRQVEAFMASLDPKKVAHMLR
ncbi:MAG TPA: alpha/beta hydrolase [Macromonas sp.]|nr:alpha/beta hydrolase [Macromonas sp.]